MAIWRKLTIAEHRGNRLGLWLRRAFWGGLLALHAAPVAASWNAAWIADVDAAVAAQIRLAMLLGSIAFFILKVMDVPWLRLRPGRQSAAASLVVLALLHYGVIDRAAGLGIAYGPEHLGIVLFLGGAVSTDAGRTLLRQCDRCRHAVIGTNTERVAYLRALDCLIRPPQWAIALTATGPRAPPSR